MTTASTTFAAKIRNLNEYYNNIVNCSLPVANTGADIASTLKSLSVILLNVLKDVALDENSLVDTESHNTTTNTDKTHSSHDNDETGTINGGGGGDASGTGGSGGGGLPENKSFSNLGNLGTIASGNNVASLHAQLNTDEKIYPHSSRIKKFPNHNYSGLYHALLNIIEIIPSIQSGQLAVGQALIHTFSCLAPFLADDLLESLPYTIALTLTTFPVDLHKAIMDTLCNCLLPITFYSERTEDSFVINSISSIIMIVLNYGKDPTFYSQLFECLLGLKRNLVQDVLCSIAYGTYRVRYHATNLMFKYWPRLNPIKSDHNSHYAFLPRKQVQCQSEKCIEKKNLASKVCIDPNISMHGANVAPLYHMCNECYRDVPKRYQLYCQNLVQPVMEISAYCENRSCKATDKVGYAICYSSSCIIINQNKPVTLCKECHTSKHSKQIRKSDHIFQLYIENLWTCDAKTRTYLNVSIINLLKEVPLFESKKGFDGIEDARKHTISSSSQAHAASTSGQAGQSQAAGANAGNLSAAANSNIPISLAKGDITNLIGVGLIGALNNNGHSNTGTLASNLFAASTNAEESNFHKRLLSRYGCYLIISLIKPEEVGELEIFGRIISMVLQWFHMVCYIPHDASGELISKLRTQFVLPWIKKICENHFELVVSCLIPHPPDFAKVGGVWETKSKRSTQIKEDFTKFCDLIPYEIVNYEIWDYAMPFWIEAIITEVPDKYIAEFKPLFVKLFDPDMTPIPFGPDQIYHFISERFEGTASPVQEQALSWLQILCELDVSIPFQTLTRIFTSGLSSLQKLEMRAIRRSEAYANASDIEQSLYNTNNVYNNNIFTVFDTYEAYRVYRNQLMLLQITGQELATLIKEEEEDFVINNRELNITCCIMMLDMTLKQFELQRPPPSLGMYNPLSKDLLSLLTKQIVLPWVKKHKCKQQFGFLSSENIALPTGGAASYCQFCEEYVLWFTFAKEIIVYISPKQELELPETLNNQTLFSSSTTTPSHVVAVGGASGVVQSATGKAGSPPKLTSSSSQDDSDARELADGVNATPKKAPIPKTDPNIGVWVTTYGVYYFKIAQLPAHLQLFYSMLTEIKMVPDVDAFYNLLICLKILVIHDDVLETANKDKKGFLIYCLEKLLVPNLWKVLSGGYCHLNDLVVPILLHCLVYESGQSTFWSFIEKDFKDPNWKVRMQAVSRVVAIAHHLKPKQIRLNFNIYSSLSYAFANLIYSTNDIEPIVAQKAISLIETLSEQAIKSIINCFEFQFDTVIADRIIVVQLMSSFYTIASKNQTILTWEFFLQRFNSIFFENQMKNDIISPVDISGINSNNTNFQRKVNMARFALKRSELVRTISADQNNPYFSHKKINEIFRVKQDLQKAAATVAPSRDKELAAPASATTTTDTAKAVEGAEPSPPPPLPTQEPPAKLPEETTVLVKEERPAVEEKAPGADVEDEDVDKRDLENQDKQIMHALVTLLMKFMVNDDQSAINEDRIMIKQQNTVLKHLYSLLKYNINEQVFSVQPNRIRKSPAVNAFISGLPMVMDRNFALGNILMPVVLRLLRFLPSDQMDDITTLKNDQIQAEEIMPAYTIGHLNTQTRHSWLLTLTVILYKYQYNSPNDSQNLAYFVKQLLQIVINTLNFQFHKCDLATVSPINRKDQASFYSLRSDVPDTARISSGNLNDSISGNITHTSIQMDNEDEMSTKSGSEKQRKLRGANLGSTKNLFKITKKPGSVSISGGLNQADDISVKSKSLIKGLKVLVSSKSNQNIDPQQKAASKKDKSTADALDLRSVKDVKSPKRGPIPFTLSIFTKSKYQKSSVKQTKKKLVFKGRGHGNSTAKTGGPMPYSSGDEMMRNKMSPLGRRSAVALISDEAEENEKDNLMSSSLQNLVDYLGGECGLCHVKCQRCGRHMEIYNEDIIGSLIVICSTIVHRESTLAAPFILDMIMSITKIASKKIYSWQANYNYYLPGNYCSIAKQFLRCTLHQLVSNQIFFQLFQSRFESPKLLETIAIALNDFNELQSVTALKHILNDLNLQKSLSLDVCLQILNNVATYMDYLPLESQQSQWILVMQELEILFLQLNSIMNKSCDYSCLFLIMITLLKVPSINNVKTILEPFSRLLCFILQNCFFKLEHLIDICSLSNRAFTKDRDKQYLPRCIINELVYSITVKVHCVDRNLLLLLQFAVLDAGGNIYKSATIENETDLYDPHYCIQTSATDCFKQHTNDIIAFIADIHTITKVKQNLKADKSLQSCLSEDSLGAQLKAGLAQFLALEFTELNKCKDRDSRSIVKYLPWLSNLPPNAQQGAKEFVECIDHIRFLSWLLIGSLTHSALTRNKGTVISYPIPINCGNYIGEHIFYILNGFAEHSKTSAIHMSSLFHSFILCQLWTMYCEQIHVTYDSENDSSALNAIMEFWTKITPGILQLLSQTKVLADMVTLHFLSLIEGLQEYNSLVLAKFFPMWVPVLYMSPMHSDQLKRVKQCLNYQPPTEAQINSSANYSILVKCLQRLQYKIAMIESQSSNAALLF